MQLDQGEVKVLFEKARRLSGARRDAFLREACLGRPDLRTDVESLLASSDGAAEYFEELADRVLPVEVRALADSAVNSRGSDPLVGQVISHYEILERLGSGGMGVVYKARHLQLERFVALKFLPSHLCADAEAKARFVQEAKAAYSLDHPNICTIYDIGETADGHLFMAMAFYEGETLKERITLGRMPYQATLNYVRQITEGLQRAHENGIVHRDIKPANLLITREDVVKILDFGVAKDASVSPMTKTGRMLGTIAYMSPEQARGENVDVRTDLWSLGVVWYEMLMGKRPFHAEYDQAILYSILNEDPEPAGEKDDVPGEVWQMLSKCLEKTRDRRYQSAADLFADIYRFGNTSGLREGGGGPGDQRSELDMHTNSKSESIRPHHHGKGSGTARIFISYRRGADPDEELARSLVAGLEPSHEVFIDKMLTVGARWVERIEFEISQADYFIVLLSAHSVQSEMVLAEIELASQFSRRNGGHPVILPIRVKYIKDFAYPLSSYLDHLNWTYWDKSEDTPIILRQIETAVDQGWLDGSQKSDLSLVPEDDTGPMPAPHVSAQPLQIESPEGTMDPQSTFYVERDEDRLAMQAIEREGVTITIKGPRQMGKSSLLLRTMQGAKDLGKRIVFIDFQLFDAHSLADGSTFFRQFCSLITDELELEDRVDEFWRRPLGNSQLCTRYVSRHVLASADAPVFLAMDEVERVFDTEFRSDFFSMLRSWHNDRAMHPKWKKLDLALVTSTEPYQLIENLNQSPFNVGEVIELNDFTDGQVKELNIRHGSPLTAEDALTLNAWLGGHPYLTRKALFLLATGRTPLEELLSTATEDHGPFGDHLRHHLFRLHGKTELAASMRSVLRNGVVDDEAIYWRLRGAGLVRREGRTIVPRCRLYSEYFAQRLDA